MLNTEIGREDIRHLKIRIDDESGLHLLPGLDNRGDDVVVDGELELVVDRVLTAQDRSERQILPADCAAEHTFSNRAKHDTISATNGGLVITRYIVCKTDAR